MRTARTLCNTLQITFKSLQTLYRDVAQLVERTVRDRKVVGSSPAIPTILMIFLDQLF